MNDENQMNLVLLKNDHWSKFDLVNESKKLTKQAMCIRPV